MKRKFCSKFHVNISYKNEIYDTFIFSPGFFYSVSYYLSVSRMFSLCIVEYIAIDPWPNWLGTAMDGHGLQGQSDLLSL